MCVKTSTCRFLWGHFRCYWEMLGWTWRTNCRLSLPSRWRQSIQDKNTTSSFSSFSWLTNLHLHRPCGTLEVKIFLYIFRGFQTTTRRRIEVYTGKGWACCSWKLYPEWCVHPAEGVVGQALRQQWERAAPSVESADPSGHGAGVWLPPHTHISSPSILFWR